MSDDRRRTALERIAYGAETAPGDRLRAIEQLAALDASATSADEVEQALAHWRAFRREVEEIVGEGREHALAELAALRAGREAGRHARTSTLFTDPAIRDAAREAGFVIMTTVGVAKMRAAAGWRGPVAGVPAEELDAIAAPREGDRRRLPEDPARRAQERPEDAPAGPDDGDAEPAANEAQEAAQAPTATDPAPEPEQLDPYSVEAYEEAGIDLRARLGGDDEPGGRRRR